MKNTTSWILVLLIGAIGAAGGFWFGSRASTRADAERLIVAATQPSAPSATTMTPAPNATQTLFATSLNNLAGQSVKLDQYKGKTLIVNFWASWCPPCIAEMPELSRFYKDHASKDLQMIGIAIDNPTSVRNFLKARAVSYPVLLGGMDGTDLSAKLGDHQGGLPFTAIIAPDGAIVFQKLGQTSYTELLKHLPGTS